MRTRPPTRLDPDEDARLAARCLAGDERAWEELVRRHEGLVYAVGRSYRVSDDDLAEVFQDVFTALYQRLAHVRDTRSLCRWLASTAERIGRAAALRRRREDARHTDLTVSLDLLAAEDTDPARGVEELEMQALVRLALDELQPRCRALLHALYYEDPPVPYAELAERLRMSIGSIGPTRARCFDRLREALTRQDAGRSISGTAVLTSPDDDEREDARSHNSPRSGSAGEHHDS